MFALQTRVYIVLLVEARIWLLWLSPQLPTQMILPAKPKLNDISKRCKYDTYHAYIWKVTLNTR